MKIASFKEVSKKVDAYNALADQLKRVRTDALFLCFGDMVESEPEAARKWLKYKLSATTEAELRERMISSIILEMEKIKSALEELGVEL